MAEPHVVTGLIHKRSELAGQIEHHQTVLRQLIIDLDNLDATLRLFVPDIELAEIKPKPFPPRHAAFKGEVARVIFSALRQSDCPLSTYELTRMFMAERELNTADLKLVKTIGKRVGSSLRHHRIKGTVRSVKGPESFLLWEITG